MAKSYKQLYEETKGMLEKYQDEIVPKLREQAKPITKEEISALRAVAYGCNTNRALQGVAGYSEALITVYKLIERLEG